MDNKHVLTLHTITNGEDWFSRSGGYGKKEIEAIEDPEGGNTKEPPTSIPSPFARFDLVRTAFARLAQFETLTGKDTHNDERLVSECFDVGELFFNFDKLKDNLDIISWNKTDNLNTLRESSAVGHQRLGAALNLFLEQDGGQARQDGGYNFARMDSLFILRYTDDRDSGIVGGTSPSTLFFSAPHSLKFVNVQFGNQKLFGDGFTPLHLRDADYQKFWHGLSTRPGFGDCFPEVLAYLQKSLNLLKQQNNKLWQQIGNGAEKLRGDAFETLFDNLTSANGDLVEILDYRMKKVRVDATQFSRSGFVLNSEKYARLFPDKLSPMLLQENYQGRLIYTKDYWNKAQAVPPVVAEDWRENKRKLPGQADFYPWLTISDFLDPYIIRLVYPINADKFYDGGLTGNSLLQSYLLPLTKTFFDFFDADDLIAGKKVKLLLENRAGNSVKATLTIPLLPGEPPIVFDRIYYANDISEAPRPANETRNEGAVTEYQFGVNLMPFVRFANGPSPIYRVQVVDQDLDHYTYGNDYKLQFLTRDNKPLPVAEPKERSRKKQNVPDSVTTKYYAVGQNFDYIAVEAGGRRGLILPRFDQALREPGAVDFTFAIDFGTTNTHIEYTTNADPNPKAFTMGVADDENMVGKSATNPADSAIATLHHPDPTRRQYMNAVKATDIADVVPVELHPDRIGPHERASFPTRTALLENTPRWAETLAGFMDFNPALLYEKQNLMGYTVETNLKWANYRQDDREEKRVEAYIQSLLLLVRNKVLLNNGNLAATKLVWFYPLSMLETRRNYFEEVWNRQFAAIISTKTFPQRIPESTAPYYWYEGGSGEHAIQAESYPAVCVDIGGGTSDVVVFQRGKPTLITSFRFAANAIFGDAFATEGAALRNGFVRKYETKITALLNDNGFGELVKAYEKIKGRQRSEDIVAFFFSLKDNRDLQGKVSIDFNEMLGKDESLKIVFLVFYTALVYHIAQMMKARQMAMPRYIAFSGNGSKVLRVLSTKPAVLSQLARLIYQSVYEADYHTDGLEVIVEQKAPKEATCKGGLKHSTTLRFDRADDGRNDELIEATKRVLLGTTDQRFAGRKDTYETIGNDPAVLTDVVGEVRAFLTVLFSVNETMPFKDKFGVRAGDLDEYRKILEKDLADNVQVGFKRKRNDSDQKDPVEETLFFYPLVKGLNALAAHAANQ